MLSYEGLFFDEETVKLIHSLEEDTLDVVNDEIHCTFKYHPANDEIFNEIVGKYFDVYLVGYANGGKNSGFKIEIFKKLEKYYIHHEPIDQTKLITHHITA